MGVKKIKKFFILSILLLCILAISFTQTAFAAFPGTNGLIAFARETGTNHEIWVMNPDGSNQKRLTTDPSGSIHPSWSPDGSKIAFTMGRNNGNQDIYVMNADGSGQTRLTSSPARDHMASWSPDGTKIVFCSLRDSQGGDDWQIYVMNADGTNVVRLTQNILYAMQPHWSPDGSKIVFAGNEQDAHPAIYIMDANGSNMQKLTTNTLTDFQPDWSPDGSKIVFSREIGPTDQYDLFVMNADGSNPTQLTATVTLDEFSPSWSPDGTKIVFNYYGDGRIAVINADGTGRIDLTNGAFDDWIPAWQSLKLTSTLTLQSSITNTTVDTDFVLNATLSVSKSSPVTLYWSINGSGFDFSQTGTMTNGIYDRIFAAGSPGNWVFKVVWAGDYLYKSVESNNVTVTVRSLPVLAVLATADPTTVYSGGTSTIRASLTSEGAAITGATVSLASSNDGTFSTVTDQGNGTYVATFTAPDIVTQTVCTMTASASKSGYQSGTGQTQATVQPLVMNIYVKASDGTPIAGATVVSTTQPNGQAALSGSTDANGLVVFTGIMKGSYTIKASKSGYDDNAWTGTATAGQLTTQSIMLGTPFPYTYVIVGIVAVVIVVGALLALRVRRPKA